MISSNNIAALSTRVGVGRQINKARLSPRTPGGELPVHGGHREVDDRRGLDYHDIDETSHFYDK